MFGPEILDLLKISTSRIPVASFGFGNCQAFPLTSPNSLPLNQWTPRGRRIFQNRTPPTRATTHDGPDGR